MRRINRRFIPLVRARPARFRRSPAISSPEPLAGAATGLLWGGLVRVFFVHHVTWSVNSVCHFLGTRRFEVEDHSTNVFWLALPSLGESWHHNHHAFPRSAVHGLRRWELDPSALLIRGDGADSASPGTWSGSRPSARRRSSPNRAGRTKFKPLLSPVSGSSQPPLA